MNSSRLVSLSLSILLGSALLYSQTSRMEPFAMNWHASDGALVDASFLLDKPAGKNGFIQIRDGHLVTPNGKRFRIWGFNSTAVGNVPKQDAETLAAYWARMGVNSVRFHFMDSPRGSGLVDGSAPDSQHFDPAALDRFDYLVAQLKKHGIYTNINLNAGREFRPGDGVKGAEMVGLAKAITLFDPHMIELEKTYAHALLTHKNPYTNSEYRNEPAVAIIEIVNENWLIEAWVMGRLGGKLTGPPVDRTWTDIPVSYGKDLTELYNAWLQKHLKPEELRKLRAEAGVGEGAPIPRLEPKLIVRWGGATPDAAALRQASDLRFRSEARFYMDLENRFFQTMYRFLKDDVGVKCPVLGTSAFRGSFTPYPLLVSNSKLDIVDAHTYWQHPDYRTDPASGRRISYQKNSPMINDPELSMVMTLSRSAVAGKPFTISEVNEPFANDTAVESFPILTAYSGFHDWDGIYWFQFGAGSSQQSEPMAMSYFNIAADPVKMAQFLACGVVFQRGDVKIAKETVLRSYTEEQILESIRMDVQEAPYFSPGFPRLLPLVHGSRLKSAVGSSLVPPSMTFSNPVISDTGELKWYRSENNGALTINTPNAQGIVGFSGLKLAQPDNLQCDISSPFAAVMLVSTDGGPLSSAEKMVLAVGAGVANTGMKWEEGRTLLVDPGRVPVVIEVVQGSLTLKSLKPARKVEAVPLDGAARQMREPLPAEKTPTGWRIKLGEVATPWYLIRVSR